MYTGYSQLMSHAHPCSITPLYAISYAYSQEGEIQPKVCTAHVAEHLAGFPHACRTSLLTSTSRPHLPYVQAKPSRRNITSGLIDDALDMLAGVTDQVPEATKAQLNKSHTEVHARIEREQVKRVCAGSLGTTQCLRIPRRGPILPPASKHRHHPHHHHYLCLARRLKLC